MKKESFELRVGFFVLVALAALGVLVFRAGDFTFKPGYTIRIVFTAASGIEKGSPVHLSGVHVGQVADLRIFKDADGATMAEIFATINQGVFIEEDSEAYISTLGLLGEKYVEIRPGTPGVKGLSDGSTLAGSKQVMLEKITEAGTRVIQKIELTVDSINNVVAEPAFQDSVRNTFVKTEKTFSNAEIVTANLIETTDDLKAAAKSARVVLERLEKGEGTIGRLLKDESMARDLEAFAKDIKANPWKLLKRS